MKLSRIEKKKNKKNLGDSKTQFLRESKSQNSTQNPQNHPKSLAQKFKHTLTELQLTARLKAFITDIFMIYMPILYIATYLVLGSKEAFQQSEMGIFVCFLLYALIVSLFLYFKAQTPGYRYAQIALFRDNASDNLGSKKLGFFLILFRFFVFCASMALVFGLFFPFFRKDSKTFHDFICGTKIKNFS